ncbi:MAG: peptidoglycan-binding protein [Pseudanabaena sp. ELA607]
MLDNSYLYTIFVEPASAAFYDTDATGTLNQASLAVNWRNGWQRAVTTSVIVGILATGTLATGSRAMAADAATNSTVVSTTTGSNSNVRYVQTLLANNGFNPGPIDGVAGNATKNAILRAQQKFGLTTDGVAGAATIAKLEQQLQASPDTIVIAQASRGDVVNLQKLLTDRGFYDGAIDGVMGPKTRAAVVAAQKKYGLTADGVAGPKTLAALEAGSSASSNATGTVQVTTSSSTTTTTAAATTSAKTNDVRRLQELLAKRGFYSGTVDGIAGKQTRDAVIAAQKAYGLTPDGVAGPRTLAALESGAKPTTTNTNTTTTTTTNNGATSTQTNNQTTVIRGSNTTRTNTNTTNTNTRSSNDGDANVRDLQALLSDRGFYTGAVDGVMGQETTAAIVAAQKKYGLTADGVAGPLTLAALESNAAASAVTASQPKPAATTAPAAASNEDIANLQNLLTDRGFYNGPITGVTGPSTRNAVIAAQKAYGLNPDGVAGPATIAALEANQKPVTPAVNPPAKPAVTSNATSQPKPAATPAAATPKPATKPVVATATPAATNSAANNAANNTVAQGGQAQVLQLQQLLAKRGFYNGQANGVLNGETRNAIIRAQNFYAVNPADGTPSQALVENLSKDNFVADN